MNFPWCPNLALRGAPEQHSSHSAPTLPFTRESFTFVSLSKPKKTLANPPNAFGGRHTEKAYSAAAGLPKFKRKPSLRPPIRGRRRLSGAEALAPCATWRALALEATGGRLYFSFSTHRTGGFAKNKPPTFSVYPHSKLSWKVSAR